MTTSRTTTGRPRTNSAPSAATPVAAHPTRTTCKHYPTPPRQSNLGAFPYRRRNRTTEPTNAGDHHVRHHHPLARSRNRICPARRPDPDDPAGPHRPARPHPRTDFVAPAEPSQPPGVAGLDRRPALRPLRHQSSDAPAVLLRGVTVRIWLNCGWDSGRRAGEGMPDHCRKAANLFASPCDELKPCPTHG